MNSIRLPLGPRTVLALVFLAYCAVAESVNSAQFPAAFGPIHPRVSPDGQWLACSWQGSIVRLPVEGGTLTRLTSGEGFDVEPVWSPDGKRIALINAANFSAGQLRIINASSGEPVQLPQAVRADGRMFWHPDGRRLLGRFSVSAVPSAIAWYDLDSGRVQPVEFRPRESQVSRAPFCLSADGRWILFAQHQDVPGEQWGNDGPQADLWRAPANGGEAVKLFRWPARIYNLESASDSQGVFAVTDRGVPHNDIWLIPVESSLRDARKLTTGQADEDWPSTPGDGALLVHTDNQEGPTQLFQMNFASKERRIIPVRALDFRSPVGTVRLRLLDEQGQPAVARISVKEKGGKFHAPLEALYRVLGGMMHFYGRAEVSLEVPAGSYEITASRGPEYRGHKSEFTLAAGQSLTHTIQLERWTDAASRGWFSGENHIHANYGYGHWHVTPRALLDQCEGEDLNVCNAVVANSDGDGVFDRQFFLGAPDALSKPRTILYWNEEFRSTIWGHLTLQQLTQLVEPIFTGFKDTTNPYDVPTNADIAGRTRAQGGMVSYTHPANSVEDPYAAAYSAKGLPVDAALGRIDTLDVAGGGYLGSMHLWYRLLNCGFRLPAAAGTDCFLNRILSSPPGWARAYVKLSGGLSYDGWMAGQRAGRSFITDGPMIELSVDERELGDTLRLEAPRAVRVRGQAQWQHPLEKLELVYNGRVVANGNLTADKREVALDQELNLDTSGWVVLRTFGAGGGLWAHTNPIYIEVAGRPLDSRVDAEFFLKWIDRLEAQLRKRDRFHTGRSHVEMQLAAARAVYQKLIQAGSASPAR